jgi:hypothetical protein
MEKESVTRDKELRNTLNLKEMDCQVKTLEAHQKIFQTQQQKREIDLKLLDRMLQADMNKDDIKMTLSCLASSQLQIGGATPNNFASTPGVHVDPEPQPPKWDTDGNESSAADSFQLLVTQSDSASVYDESSATDASSPKCYLPNTGFKGPDGNLLVVQHLRVGDIVKLSDGRQARVVSITPYKMDKKIPYELCMLATAQGTFEVSSTHRIVVPGGERRADQLKDGDEILVGSKRRKLIKVTEKLAPTDLYEVGFDPDGHVEAFPVPTFGIQTLGEPSDDMVNADGSESLGGASCQGASCGPIVRLDQSLRVVQQSRIEYEEWLNLENLD